MSSESGNLLGRRATEKTEVTDYKRILFMVIKNWYFVVLSLLLTLSAAYFINKYSVKTYPVSMTLLIKDQNEQDNAVVDLLYNGRGFTPGKNYFNEEILLQSYPLIKRTIDDLDFDVAFYVQGDIKLSEIYPKPPIKLTYDSTYSAGYGRWLNLKVESNEYFWFSTGENELVRHKFGEEFEVGGRPLTIEKQDTLDEYFDVDFTIRILNNKNTARAYSGRISIDWLAEGSSILSVGVNGPNPKKDIAFLTALARTYQSQDLEEKNLNATKTMEFIDLQLAEISDSLERLELKVKVFKENNFVTGISAEAERFYGALEEFNAEQSKVIVEEKYYDYLSQYLNNENDFEILTIPASVGINNTLLNDFVDRLVKLQLERKKLSRFSSESGSVFLKEIDAQIEDGKASLRATLASLKSSLQITKQEIKTKINRVSRNISLLPDAEREYVSLSRMHNLSESLYLILMEKKAEAGITKASNTSDVVLVNPATISGGMISPKVGQNYIMALLIGIGIPILLIFLIDYFNNKVKFKEDIEALTDIPFLGVIGHNTQDQNLVLEMAPRSAIAESFRSVRSNINFFVGDSGHKRILVTSSLSGEGKTFFSNNLALIFAYSGKKTVLIGADMRRPKIFEDFQVHNNLGLSNYLSSDIDAKDIIQSTRFENLSIINSGTVPPNPSELLIKDRLKGLLETLEKDYDHIIIDSPPLGLVTDALVLVKHVNHTVYVVRQGYTPKGTIKNIQEIYEAGKIENISILFNDISINKYGYGYGYSYGYGYTYSQGYGQGQYYSQNEKKRSWKFWEKG